MGEAREYTPPPPPLPAHRAVCFLSQSAMLDKMGHIWGPHHVQAPDWARFLSAALSANIAFPAALEHRAAASIRGCAGIAGEVSSASRRGPGEGAGWAVGRCFRRSAPAVQ